jgi:hypothetical protein
MDFKLFLGVLKRYKRMVIGGMVLAVLLSVLSYGTPGLQGGKPTIIPRGSEVWQGQAELLISQQGFPYGRAVQQIQPGKGADIPSQVVGDFNYMASLSSVYAAVANGNSVQHQVAREAGVPLCPATEACGTVVATEVDDISDGVPLPLVTLTASAATAVDAAKLATTTVAVLEREITQQETAAGTPADQRVVLQTVKTGAPATLAQGHKKSIPILVLFAVIAATIALAFIRNSHSDDPVRSTRRHLDDGLDPDGGRVFAGAGNGRVAEPEHSRVQTGGGGNGGAVTPVPVDLLEFEWGEPAPPPAEETNATPQPAVAEDSTTRDRLRALSSRRSGHVRRASDFEPESRD